LAPALDTTFEAARVDRGCASRETRDLERKRLSIQIGTIAMFGVGIPSAIRYWTLGLPLLTCTLVLTMSACAANLLWLRRGAPVRLAGNVAVGMLFALLTFSISASGGFYDPNFAWIYTVPVAAACLVDLRSGWIWTVVATAATAIFWGIAGAGYEVPNLVPKDQQHGQALFNRVTAILGLAILATSFVVSQRRTERDLAASNRELLREGQCVRLLQDVAVAANEADTLPRALEVCTRLILETTAWRVGHVWVPAIDGSGDFESSGIWIAPEAPETGELLRLTQERRFAPGEQALGRAVQTGQTVWTSEGKLDPLHSPRGRAALAAGLQCAVGIPIAASGRVIAVLEFFGSDPAPLDERLIRVLGDVGQQVGRVAERLLLNDQLRQSQKLESVGQLAAGIAHEINNPMAYVRANLSVLREDWRALQEEARKHGWPDAAQARFAECEELIDESLEGVDRTVSIVRDVKAFARASETQTEVAELGDLVEGSLRVATSQRPADIAIERHYAEDGLSIQCLPGQLRQVFLNLIVNAFQAMSGGGTLRVATDSTESQVIARIEDTGCGIPASDLQRLFDPFFTTKPAGQGTGLGLYISYEIVRGHGGEIVVDSEPGRGSRFEVRLPRGAA